MNQIDEKENILYRPQLEPGRKYDSDASFEHRKRKEPDITPYIPEEKVVEKLQKDMKELKRILTTVPDVGVILNPTIEKLITRSKIAFPDGEAPQKTMPPEIPTEVIPTTPFSNVTDPDIDDPDDEFGEMPALFPEPSKVSITILAPRSKANIAYESYSKDSIDLQKNYLNKLQMLLHEYYQQMMMVMAQCNVSSIDNLTMDFDGKAVSVPVGSNLEHLRDEICRSQVERKQKINLFRKTHNVDQTIMHMRAWHAAEAERERYYSEQYGDSASYLDNEKNKILRDSRKKYDSRYEQTFYDMYKYLNSSVIITKDILDMSLNETKAKGALLNAGVNIFATRDNGMSASLNKETGSSSKKDSEKETKEGIVEEKEDTEEKKTEAAEKSEETVKKVNKSIEDEKPTKDDTMVTLTAKGATKYECQENVDIELKDMMAKEGYGSFRIAMTHTVRQDDGTYTSEVKAILFDKLQKK